MADLPPPQVEGNVYKKRSHLQFIPAKTGKVTKSSAWRVRFVDPITKKKTEVLFTDSKYPGQAYTVADRYLRENFEDRHGTAKRVHGNSKTAPETLAKFREYKANAKERKVRRDHFDRHQTYRKAVLEARGSSSPSSSERSVSSNGSVPNQNASNTAIPLPQDKYTSLDGLSISLQEWRKFYIGGQVYIAKSRIPGAGDGLFAKRNFQKGEIICDYAGQVVKGKLPENWEEESAFIISNPENTVHIRGDVNGHDPVTFGAYANDGLGEVNANAEIVFNDQEKAMLRATRNIQTNEEIILNYGRNYWLDPIEKKGGKLSDYNTPLTKKVFAYYGPPKFKNLQVRSGSSKQKFGDYSGSDSGDDYIKPVKKQRK